MARNSDLVNKEQNVIPHVCLLNITLDKNEFLLKKIPFHAGVVKNLNVLQLTCPVEKKNLALISRFDYKLQQPEMRSFC